jgi:hypothetical protein
LALQTSGFSGNTEADKHLLQELML